MRACLLLIASMIGSGQGLEFEVASVRGPTPPPAVQRMNGGPGTSDPERISYSRARMGPVIMMAFGLRPNEIIGPDWLFEPNDMTAPAYDIEAKVPAGATKEQARQMMQNLLKARFHLAYHFEKRRFDAYNLVVAKSGAKLKPAAPPVGPAPAQQQGVITGATEFAKDADGFPILPPGYPKFRGVGADGHMRLTARALPMSQIVELFQGDVQRRYQVNYVVDKTGLTGTYDFKLDSGNRAGGAESAAPEFMDAVEEQLGLRFEKSKIEAQVLVIDHVDKTPTDNRP